MKIGQKQITVKKYASKEHYDKENNKAMPAAAAETEVAA